MRTVPFLYRKESVIYESAVFLKGCCVSDTAAVKAAPTLNVAKLDNLPSSVRPWTGEIDLV